ncbi:hypothetical protein [Streptomyces sp. NBC_01304]|uniref:hypothetical protein n=1 Tax=Streptomyces sp. NBC_01304 TaxID=2903818 RepID=UPI002E12A10D|nr:hypothetical protein OG430_06245 [Streptomyces sp. NBC_01304]
MTAGRCARAVRAGVFSAVCVLLASLGHLLMTGTIVPCWTLIAGALFIGAGAWSLGGRERGPAMVVMLTLAAQAALHLAFSLSRTAVGGAPGPQGHGAHDVPFTAVGALGALGHDMSATSMSALAMNGMPTDGIPVGGMFAAHVLAALLSGLWLAHGERATFRILRAVAGWLGAPLRVLFLIAPLPRGPRLRMRRARAAHILRPLLLVHTLTSRGPPARPAVL